MCCWYGYFTVWITEYKTFIFSQSHFVCVCACMRPSSRQEYLCFCFVFQVIWLSVVPRELALGLFTFFFLPSVLRCSRQPYLGSLCRLNHYTSRWEVVLWASHWFIYSADSFRNDTTVWRSEFCVANIAIFFQKSTSWTKLIWCQTHLYCLTSMFYNPNDIFKCKYTVWKEQLVYWEFGCIII